MDELVARLTDKVGIGPAVSETAAGMMLGFLRKEGPSPQVEALIASLPGAERVIAANAPTGLSGLMGGGLMALGTRLMAQGLGMQQIQAIARELFRLGRDRIGADRMGEIVAETPGLRQFT